MNFYISELGIGRQRGRQWLPLITQQFRLRHLYQLMCYNLLPEIQGSFYVTLHLTTMCSPFYTSEQVANPHPKWLELDLRNIPNTSASCIVLRIWQNQNNGVDKIVLTWGVNFSGLVYIGNKIADIQPIHFKNNSVIFSMVGGYFTSPHMIRNDLQKPLPFINSLNVMNTMKDPIIFKRVAIGVNRHDIQDSYNIDKLRKLHSLQLQIKRKFIDVQNIRERINTIYDLNPDANQTDDPVESLTNNRPTMIRYAPQLLTMNSLNKMLQEKPTRTQKKEMMKIRKKIEIAKFKTRLLSQEKDKKNVALRQLKQQFSRCVDENEERNSDLMENYYKLSRNAEKLKEFKKTIAQQRDIYANINAQLNQRRRQLLKELLFIFPIEMTPDFKFKILGIHLPNSDILADCSDTGLSVALGYIAHILVMCSIFLQVPLRYPLTHYGSRSFITDNVSPLLPEKERDFPLFTRGKDKAQFTYAVYLLNKNIAQLRWLVYMNTNDLKATLNNLMTFLQGHKETRPEPQFLLMSKTIEQQKQTETSQNSQLTEAITKNIDGGSSVVEKRVSLHSFGSISNISDPILDYLRQDNKQMRRSISPTRRLPVIKKSFSQLCRNRECGKGLSEILAIPEAYLNKQISKDSLKNYMVAARYNQSTPMEHTCCDSTVASSSCSIENTDNDVIEVINGKETHGSSVCDLNLRESNHLIEQGHDPLDPKTNIPLPTTTTKSIEIHNRKLDNTTELLSNNRRISKSVGSYGEVEHCNQAAASSSQQKQQQPLKFGMELGSEPFINVCDGGEVLDHSRHGSEDNLCSKLLLDTWLLQQHKPGDMFDNSNSKDMYRDDCSSIASEQDFAVQSTPPLMARTDALLNTKSFNLVKPKQ